MRIDLRAYGNHYRINSYNNTPRSDKYNDEKDKNRDRSADDLVLEWKRNIENRRKKR